MSSRHGCPPAIPTSEGRDGGNPQITPAKVPACQEDPGLTERAHLKEEGGRVMNRDSLHQT